MQLVCADRLSQSADDNIPLIGTPFPRIDEPFYAPIPCVASRRRNLVAGSLWLIWILLRRWVRCPLKKGFALDREIDAMVRSKAVIDLSGDMLTEDYGPHIGFSHFLPILQALALGKPVIILAQSVGPFRRLAPLARLILRRASLVTVREDVSLQLVRGMGVDERRLVRTADLAFLMQAAGESQVDEILRREGAEDPSADWLGVSVSALLVSQRGGQWGTRGIDPLEELARALDGISARHGLTPLFISHVTGPRPSGDDRQVARMLQSRMRGCSLTLEGDYRPEEVKGIIGRCRVFLGLRMHANIAALDSLVPTLAIGYSHKTLGIMRLLGVENLVIPFNELCEARLEERLEYLVNHRHEVRRHLQDVLPGIREAARRNFTLVAEVLARQSARENRAG